MPALDTSAPPTHKLISVPAFHHEYLDGAISLWCVYAAIRSKALPVYKIGRRILVRPSEALEALKAKSA